ncbi:blue copper protein-like [Actinidia eriantha]|uniref:blue copper protein-like n=1 Tax=Actinidia eriantha TaxID=165200 RepID=UPI00258435A3|nr:blue copper protein-like [Actinidia eriantha]
MLVNPGINNPPASTTNNGPSPLPLQHGNDVVTLATPGRKWYICGIGKHCASGNMELAITVLPQVESPAPAPSPILPSAATGITLSKHDTLVVGVVGVLMMIMV